ncbi:hypothetical protein AVEN_243962-1, partial [Araneus ventricosus]
AIPDPILACLGLSKQDLVSNPLLTLDFLRVHRLMDLMDSADIRGSSTTTTTGLICLECKTNSNSLCRLLMFFIKVNPPSEEHRRARKQCA